MELKIFDYDISSNKVREYYRSDENGGTLDLGKMIQIHIIEILPINSLSHFNNISFYSRNFTSLPSNIVKLTNLKILTLSANKLITLPNMDELVNLEKLDLFVNKFEIFPITICSLVNLRELDIYGNKITTIPTEISNLVKLEKLWISYNKLRSIPYNIQDLESLEVLDISHNDLSSLPERITRLKSIKYLDLRGNSFESFSLNIEIWISKIGKHGKVYR